MWYKKGSLESVRETRHAQFLARLMTVAASYPPPGVDNVSDVVIGDEGLQVTSYYYELVNGEQVLHHITHTVTVDTTTTVESK